MKECDLVMKGGVTSGVVYPRALIGLSKEYRFRQVGGASAGAIAACVAAAAEYNRDGGGFERLGKIPEELASKLEDLFQPLPPYRKLFRRVLDRRRKGKSFGVWFWTRNIVRIVRAVKKLSSTNYGICSGTTTDPQQGDALVDWLNRHLEYIAGRMTSIDGPLPEQPLTFGMLKEAGITLRLVTTNLSQERPESLPLGKGFDFKEADLTWLMPENVSRWMNSQSTKAPSGFVDVPHGDNMPVILAARMSLSFPLMFTTIPLYSKDRSLVEDAAAMEVPRLNRFSDGGLSSNIPIHYFDAALPARPTFGINLTEHHPQRHGEDGGMEGWNRIYLPAQAGGGLTYGIHSINGLLSFLMSLINSAKDWQDSMQLRMPGYRERVVHVALKKDEGGFNLTMGDETVDRLLNLGDLTAQRIINGHAKKSNQPPFDFDIHRWRRVLAVSNALESDIKNIAQAYRNPSASGNLSSGSVHQMLQDMAEDFPDAARWDDLGYEPPKGAEEISRLVARLDVLSEIADKWDSNPRDPNWNVPDPKATVKFRSGEI